MILTTAIHLLSKAPGRAEARSSVGSVKSSGFKDHSYSMVKATFT